MLYCFSEVEHSQNPLLLLCMYALLTSGINIQEKHHLQMSYVDTNTFVISYQEECKLRIVLVSIYFQT